MSEWIAWGIPLLIVVAVAIIVLFILVIRIYLRGPIYRGSERLDGRTVVITGGNTGLGRQTAKELYDRGGHIIILCRSTTKGEEAIKGIKKEVEEEEEKTGKGGNKGKLLCHELDLASLQSVRDCSQWINEEHPTLHVLINNAGVWLCPEWQTADGHEYQFGVNHLGHFLLTLLLMPALRKAESGSRVVNVSSLAYKSGVMQWDNLNMTGNYSPFGAYAQSKLANLLFTKALHDKLQGSNITVICLHPGVVQTDAQQYVYKTQNRCFQVVYSLIYKTFFADVKHGAQTHVYCAVNKEVVKKGGKFFAKCSETSVTSTATNEIAAKRLWEVSLQLVGLPVDFSL